MTAKYSQRSWPLNPVKQSMFFCWEAEGWVRLSVSVKPKPDVPSDSGWPRGARLHQPPLVRCDWVTRRPRGGQQGPRDTGPRLRLRFVRRYLVTWHRTPPGSRPVTLVMQRRFTSCPVVNPDKLDWPHWSTCSPALGENSAGVGSICNTKPGQLIIEANVSFSKRPNLPKKNRW